MASSDECSREVLDTIPLLMQAIRSEVRRRHKPDLSVPQFRTLAVVYHEPGASLSQVAEHLGLTLPSMSRVVDGLVARALLARETCAADRRRLGLSVTPAGRSVFMAVRKLAQARLAEMLEPLSASERTAVVSAMRALRGVFSAAASGMPGK